MQLPRLPAAHGSYSIVLMLLALAACEGEPMGNPPGGGGGGTHVLTVTNGNGQTAFAGNFTTTAPVVRVTRNGAAASGVTVNFAVSGGGGTIVGATAVTSTTGHATLKSWRFSAVGAQQLTASVPADANSIPVNITGTATAVPASQFNIDVQFVGPTPSPSRQAAFTNAATRWQQLIVGDIPAFTLNQACDTGFPVPGSVDDIVIYAMIDSIDGPGQILGGAGPCFVRTGSLLPISGVMVFDSADVAGLEAQNQFVSVVLHEMGHALGFGTIWGPASDPGLDLLRPTPCAAQGFFRGASAIQAFWAASTTGLFPRTPVPIEDNPTLPCPGGTRDGHWREADLNAELMTGFLEAAGTPTPLSAVSVASMRDLGYVVNDAAADAFTFVPPATIQALTAEDRRLEIRERPLPWPIRIVDPAGNLVREIRRP